MELAGLLSHLAFYYLSQHPPETPRRARPVSAALSTVKALFRPAWFLVPGSLVPEPWASPANINPAVIKMERLPAKNQKNGV